MDNIHAVLHQMQAFGIVLKDKDRDWIGNLGTGTEGKKRTIGDKGKDWCKLYLFRPDRGGCYITGSFGTYKHGGSWEKVDTEWVQVSKEERERQAREREAIAERNALAKAAAQRAAALDSKGVWSLATTTGSSPYLTRKGVAGEACRFLMDGLTLHWPARERGERDTVVKLPPGTIVLPLIRYDLPRVDALRGLQFIRPDGAKIYTRAFEKIGTALRLGDLDDSTEMILVCEGYATGLTIRTALGPEFPVFVAFDAGNLRPVVEMLLEMYATPRILICADDDWKTRDKRTGDLTNPGVTVARGIAFEHDGVDYVYPAFGRDRPEKATDYNDLQQIAGIETVARQLQTTIGMIEKIHG